MNSLSRYLRLAHTSYFILIAFFKSLNLVLLHKFFEKKSSKNCCITNNDELWKRNVQYFKVNISYRYISYEDYIVFIIHYHCYFNYYFSINRYTNLRFSQINAVR